MSRSVNKVIIIGNLVRDPEIRNTQSGVKIASISVATSEQWNDKTTGEKKELAEYHRVVIMNERLGDVAEKYLRKGSKVYLEGKLQTRKWTDQSGQERYTTEIMLGRFNGELVLLGDKDRATTQQSDPQPTRSSRDPATHTGWDNQAVSDDEIPF